MYEEFKEVYTIGQPLISVIIPAFNEAMYLEKLFQGLAEQSYPRSCFEIIIADNGSTDKTQQIASEYADRLITVPAGKTVAAVRNAGAELAKGQLFAFLDADCVPDKEWLEMGARAFTGGAKVFGNKIGIPEDAGWIERAWFTRHVPMIRNVAYINSANFFVAKKLYMLVGGFDENLISGEDYDICQRIKKVGYAVESHPEIAVVHLKNPTTISAFVKRECWHGIGSLQSFNLTTVDKPLLFTLIFLCATLGQFVGIILRDIFLIAGSSILIFFLLLLSAAYNVKRSKNFNYYLHIVLLYYFYFFGRTGSIVKFVINRFDFDYVINILYYRCAAIVGSVNKFMGLNPSNLRILCYHSIADLKEGQLYPASNVLLSEFKKQMRFLQDSGFNSVSFEQLDSYLRGETKLPSKSFLVTFDDGFKNVKENALPILISHGFNAIVFITTDWLGCQNKFNFVEWHRFMKDHGGQACVQNIDSDFLPFTPSEVQQLANIDNVMVASHGCSHQPYMKMSPIAQMKQFSRSRELLEELSGHSVSHFAYPNGAYNQDSFAIAVKKYPFVYGVSKGIVKRGAAHAGCPINRHSINMHHSLDDFSVQMWGGYDPFRYLIELFSIFLK
ncbi:glycosyltransferase [Desulfobacterales bacterium HSG17]|nr:glycosyltransferase [Desulfobacterales bacterium HSG17]